eukprot:CAMPEP_0177251294 /NCGR_PEP_ID=MMETSP0367-20130122/53881_1 /TAXON_ID=447022 ORGANISM="Scrippsiella hangoei-like, Strain SHHI-4" /NCGR_SAMPLE_ID=MMETSP0367 /ASSEMBLY_ACC=CAM_ASM_000362 /LENGTH=135 /DNA_ID=CAMNT_0018704201 /DNA_START=22 /DNA_END=426 /DNA_ORIENTATION=-
MNGTLHVEQEASVPFAQLPTTGVPSNFATPPNLGSAGTNFGACGVFGAVQQQFGFPQAAWSRLHLLLPRSVVHGHLVPGGHLAEIAQGCRVQIDLRDEVAPDKICVVLSGPCASNSLAALALSGESGFWRVAAAD